MLVERVIQMRGFRDANPSCRSILFCGKEVSVTDVGKGDGPFDDDESIGEEWRTRYSLATNSLEFLKVRTIGKVYSLSKVKYSY